MDEGRNSQAASAAAGAPPRPDPGPLLERAFADIQATRMKDVPLLNPALRVEAVGLRRWEGRWLGVLITPWFMSLVLLPDAPAAWQHAALGKSVAYALPAGVFQFIGGHEPGLGEYQSCSLFSPVFEFADQDGARATALAALVALFDAASRAGVEGPGTPAATRHAADVAEPAAEAPRPPVSKRDFLRGRWRGAQDA